MSAHGCTWEMVTHPSSFSPARNNMSTIFSLPSMQAKCRGVPAGKKTKDIKRRGAGAFLQVKKSVLQDKSIFWLEAQQIRTNPAIGARNLGLDSKKPFRGTLLLLCLSQRDNGHIEAHLH